MSPRGAATVPDRFADLAFRTLPLLGMLACGGGGLAFGAGWSGRLAAWPWLLSLAVVGLPHGAADLAVGRRLGRAAWLPALCAGYVAVVILVAAGFLLAPAAGIAIFALLSAWHFGAAHAESDPAGRVGRLLPMVAIARGGVPIGVPLAAWPEATVDVAGLVAGLAGAAFPWSPATVRVAGLALVAASCAAFAAEAFLSRGLPGGPRRAGRLLAELAVIGLLGIATDPLFSIGVSFLCWHAWRQMRPLAVAVAGIVPHDAASLARALVRIHLAALPLLVPTWGAIAGLWWLLPESRLPHTPRGLAVLSIAIYLVVTPAHELLGDWLRSDTAAAGAAAPAAGRHACTTRSAACSS